MHLVVNYTSILGKLNFASARENFFLPQQSHPIRGIHCQITASELLSVFDSWDMLLSLVPGPLKIQN